MGGSSSVNEVFFVACYVGVSHEVLDLDEVSNRPSYRCRGEAPPAFIGGKSEDGISTSLACIANEGGG